MAKKQKKSTKEEVIVPIVENKIVPIEKIDNTPVIHSDNVILAEPELPIHEQLSKMINEKNSNFELYHNGTLIFNSSLSPVKPIFLFQETCLILYGKYYDYRGLQFIKK